MTDEASLPLTGHLTELRNRILIIIGTILVIFMGTYYFSDWILTLVQRPVAGLKLVFLSPTEAFFAHLKVAFFAAIFLGLPVTLLQIWRFCAPGLLTKEKRYVFPFVFFSTMCFIVGALFCYYLILPFGLRFLLSFATDSLVPQISIGFYISFVFKLILVFGFTFEIPLVTLLLVQIGVVTPEWLVTNRAYVIVGAFVVAAVLTPPDMVTQLLLAGPLIVLYEISIIIAKIVSRRKKKKAAEEEANRED
ncbi:MAG: twin-arginine translocase subunit TatC [bacterium]